MITQIFNRRRLLFWLIRAYIKKRKRTILSFFIAGILVGIAGYLVFPLLAPFIPVKTKTVGVIGSYTFETLPLDIQNKLSLGLTKITEQGEATPSGALYYETASNGKTYTFTLRDDLFWQDGEKFVASDINYNFKDVSAQVESDTKIIFTLKEPYAPFPTVLAQPLFRKGLIGLANPSAANGYGEYKVIGTKLSDGHLTQLIVETIALDTKRHRLRYKFFASEEEAYMRFMLGEVDELINLVDPSRFKKWKSVQITQAIAHNQLVTLFYNTSFPMLSDKSVRQALTYALPYDFPEEQKASSPLSPHSWAYVAQNKYSQNIDNAKKLLGDSKEASNSAQVAVTLTTTPQFKDLAEKIKGEWAKIDVVTEVRVVDIVPADPEILLERFRVSNDPDQYVLWHSTQATNISHYSNPKIDKLLEDGRQITNQEERAQIYTDFQKYIVDESPAAFLYFPIVYTVTRK